MTQEYEDRDKLLLEMGYDSYNSYLLSPLWQGIKVRQICRCRTCMVCGEKMEVVHHTSYDRKVLEGKTKSGLVSLCHRCHKLIEFNKAGRKRTLKSANKKLREFTQKRVAYHKQKKASQHKTKEKSNNPTNRNWKAIAERTKQNIEQTRRATIKSLCGGRLLDIARSMKQTCLSI